MPIDAFNDKFRGITPAADAMHAGAGAIVSKDFRGFGEMSD